MDAKPAPEWPASGVSATRIAGLVAAQLDKRFLALDLSLGSRKVWGPIAQAMSDACGEPWSQPRCQRLWRWLAYSTDIGALDHVLPDSDGEDDEPVPGTLPLPDLPPSSRALCLGFVPMPARTGSQKAVAYVCPPAVRAGVSEVERVALDRVLRAALGPEPFADATSARGTSAGAFSLWAALHRKPAVALKEERVYVAAADLRDAEDDAAAGLCGAGEVQAALEAHAEARQGVRDVEEYLSALWSEVAKEDREEFIGRASLASAVCVDRQARWGGRYEALFALALRQRAMLKAPSLPLAAGAAAAAPIRARTGRRGEGGEEEAAPPPAPAAAALAAAPPQATLPLSRDCLLEVARHRPSAVVIDAVRCEQMGGEWADLARARMAPALADAARVTERAAALEVRRDGLKAAYKAKRAAAEAAEVIAQQQQLQFAVAMGAGASARSLPAKAPRRSTGKGRQEGRGRLVEARAVISHASQGAPPSVSAYQITVQNHVRALAGLLQQGAGVVPTQHATVLAEWLRANGEQQTEAAAEAMAAGMSDSDPKFMSRMEQFRARGEALAYMLNQAMEVLATAGMAAAGAAGVLLQTSG
jgi:hypothetical protein